MATPMDMVYDPEDDTLILYYADGTMDIRYEADIIEELRTRPFVSFSIMARNAMFNIEDTTDGIIVVSISSIRGDRKGRVEGRRSNLFATDTLDAAVALVAVISGRLTKPCYLTLSVGKASIGDIDHLDLQEINMQRMRVYRPKLHKTLLLVLPAGNVKILPTAPKWVLVSIKDDPSCFISPDLMLVPGEGPRLVM